MATVLKNPHPIFKTALLALAVFLVVSGSRLMLVKGFGSDLIFCDDWDAIVEKIVLPDLHSGVSPDTWFLQHNHAHRIFWTRALSFGLWKLSPQMDNLLLCAANAFLAGLTGILAFLWSSRILRGRAMEAAWLVSLILAWPVSYDGVLWGFLNQFQFALFFAFSIFLWAGFTVLTWPRLLGGIFLGIAGVFTVGAGLLAPLAVSLTLAFFVLREKDRPNARIWIASALLLAIAMGGYLLQASERAENLSRLHLSTAFQQWGNSLAWPLSGSAWLALIGLIPFLFLLAAIRRNSIAGPRLRMLFPSLLWATLFACALAAARSKTGDILEDRYEHLLLLGPLGGYLALRYLQLEDGRISTSVPKFVYVLWPALILAVFVVRGATHLGNGAPNWKNSAGVQARLVGEFVDRQDPRLLKDYSLFEIGHDPDVIERILAQKDLHAHLPPSIIPELPLSSGPNSAGNQGISSGRAEPPRYFRQIYGSPERPANASWSLEVKDGIPWLEFFVLGNPGKGKESCLILKDLATGSERSLTPQTPRAERWKSSVVKISPGNYEVISTTPASGKPYYFTAPIPLQSGSIAARWLTNRGPVILGAGLFLLATLALWKTRTKIL